MQTTFLATALLAACAVNAIEITSPGKGDTIDPVSGVEVKWTTVSSDPTTAHLYLVNMAGGKTPYSKDLGEVDLSKGSMTVLLSSGAPTDDGGYQFNFQSVKKENTGILAQSEQFEVEVSKEAKKEETTTNTKAQDKTTVSAPASAATTAASDDDDAASTTLSTATVSVSGSATSNSSASASKTSAAGSLESSGAAAALAGGKVAQSGSFLALVVGMLAVFA